MRWSTIYISGKKGFQKEVIDELSNSNFSFMEGSMDERGLLLIWVKENSALQELKKAITAKIVFKYRLQFFSTLEEFDQSGVKNNILKFTPAEEAMVRKMHEWEENQFSRHSA